MSAQCSRLDDSAREPVRFVAALVPHPGRALHRQPAHQASTRPRRILRRGCRALRRPDRSTARRSARRRLARPGQREVDQLLIDRMSSARTNARSTIFVSMDFTGQGDISCGNDAQLPRARPCPCPPRTAEADYRAEPSSEFFHGDALRGAVVVRSNSPSARSTTSSACSHPAESIPDRFGDHDLALGG